jgi:hypothetical protein
MWDPLDHLAPPVIQIKRNTERESRLSSTSRRPNRGGGGAAWPAGLRRGATPPVIGYGAASLGHSRTRAGAQLVQGRSTAGSPRALKAMAAVVGGGGTAGDQEPGERACGAEHGEAEAMMHLVGPEVGHSSGWVELYRSAMARPWPWRPRSAARGSNELGRSLRASVSAEWSSGERPGASPSTPVHRTRGSRGGDNCGAWRPRPGHVAPFGHSTEQVAGTVLGKVESDFGRDRVRTGSWA